MNNERAEVLRLGRTILVWVIEKGRSRRRAAAHDFRTTTGIRSEIGDEAPRLKPRCLQAPNEGISESDHTLHIYLVIMAGWRNDHL